MTLRTATTALRRQVGPLAQENVDRMTALVTGCAGFTGYHVAAALLGAGRAGVGIDNLNDYYDPALKRARLDGCRPCRVRFERLDVADARPSTPGAPPSERPGRPSRPPRPACAIR